MTCYPTGRINFFPDATPAVGEILSCVILEMLPIACFFLVMFWLKFYVSGKSTATAVIGRMIGFLLGIVTAVFQTYLFNVFFCLDETAFSLCLIIFSLLNTALVTTVIYPPQNNIKGNL